MPPGRRQSDKYVYWGELAGFFSAGHSLLVYLHYARVNREVFIRERLTEFTRQMPGAQVSAFQTPRVVFFLAVQPRHAQHLREAGARLALTWHGQIWPWPG